MLGDEELEGPTTPRRMTFLGAAVCTLGMVFTAALLRELTDAARPGAALDLVNLVACVVVALSIFLFLMLRFYTPRSSIRDVLGVRPVSVVGVLLAIAGGALLAPGLSLVNDVVIRRFPPAPEDTELADKLSNLSSRGARFVVFAAFVLVIPLCHEVFFRGVVFRGLRRGRAEGVAVLGCALLYALSFVDPRLMPTALALGLLTAWLRGRSGSIVPAVLANVASKVVPFVPFVLGKPDLDVSARVAIGAVIAAGVAMWVAALVFARDDRAEAGRLLDA